MPDHEGLQFKIFNLPTGESLWIPSDLQLLVPQASSVPIDLLHFLVYIPWDPKYLVLINRDYRELLTMVLPFLHARTTDVHVAICLPFVNELIQASSDPVDQRVAHVAFILHDAGWGQMTEHEIVDSLGVDGLALTGAAIDPKAHHAELGRVLAQQILNEYLLEPPLTEDQKEMIYTAILYHDQPAQLAAMGDLPLSIQIVCDVDHLWSFTHENFWQDTIRKQVEPPTYLKNLERDLDGYFVTKPGKQKASRMLEDRAIEVSSWENWISHGWRELPDF